MYFAIIPNKSCTLDGVVSYQLEEIKININLLKIVPFYYLREYDISYITPAQPLKRRLVEHWPHFDSLNKAHGQVTQVAQE